MTIERFIIISITVLSIFSIIYIPRDQYRKALNSYLAFQATTWLVSIILVQKGITEYPVRVFVKATNVNFVFQFLFYPVIFMWFILIFPENRSLLVKLAHYILFVSIMVWFIYFTCKYTEICRFANPQGLSFVLKAYRRIFLQYGLCHLYIIWFSGKKF